MTSNTDKHTLLILLKNYNIVVPRVQRDYVQGRLDEHSNFVRENLLNDLKKAYEANCSNEVLDLNFIYGKADNNLFIPVDGQQRLTTLYLLHVYAYYDDISMNELLSHFSYEARTSTKNFFKALLEHKEEIFESNAKPSQEIADCEWFNISWIYDPSVESALVMLDAIVEKGFDREILKKELKEETNPKVAFKFLKFDNLGAEDDLYIKLNARGRSLTHYENFKSNFIDVCKVKCSDQSKLESVKLALDGKWTDLFWNYIKNSDSKNLGEECDRLFLVFFSYMFCNYNLLETNGVAIPKHWIFNVKFDSIPTELIDAIYNALNYLSNNQNSLYNKVINDCIKDTSKFETRVIFHAIIKYLEDKSSGNSVDDLAFADWYRIIRNLIANTHIDRIDRYKNAIEAINILSEHKDDLITYLSSVQNSSISGFDGSQYREECIKAKIANKSNAHKDAIIKAENTLKYFDGQIISAIKMSDFSNAGDISRFDNTVEKIAYLFTDKEPKFSNYLRRALLTMCDYTVDVDRYKTLCIDDAKEASRTRSFKYLFSVKTDVVTSLINNLDLSRNLKEQYQEYIDKCSWKENDWKYCIINDSNLFVYMSKSHYRIMETKTDIIMIPGKSSSGRNYSIYLVELEQRLKSDNIFFEYFSEFGCQGERYLKNDEKNIKVEFLNNSYIINSNGNLKTIQGSTLITDAVSYIKTLF